MWQCWLEGGWVGGINDGGSDCLFPLFTHCHFRTLLKDGGGRHSGQHNVSIGTEFLKRLLTETMDITWCWTWQCLWRVKWEYKRAEDLSV